MQKEMQKDRDVVRVHALSGHDISHGLHHPGHQLRIYVNPIIWRFVRWEY